MYAFKTTAPGPAMLVSETALTPTDFAAIGQLPGHTPFVARKSGLIAARFCGAEPEVVETRWNGKETSNTARPGDAIVTNLDASGAPLTDAEGHHNLYVIAADKFADLYQDTGRPSRDGAIHQARGTVEVLPLPGGFEIVAPWGEVQRASTGYLICNGGDVYGNHAETFDATYVRVASH